MPTAQALSSTTSSQADAGAPIALADMSETDAEPELDIEDLVERVLRKVMRRLAIESERRGWQRWN